MKTDREIFLPLLSKLKKDYKYPECSCLDSAYERKAIDDGMNSNPVFPENKKYIQERNKKYAK